MYKNVRGEESAVPLVFRGRRYGSLHAPAFILVCLNDPSASFLAECKPKKDIVSFLSALEASAALMLIVE